MELPKMNIIAILIGLVVAVALLILVLYHTSGSNALHEITFEGNKIYSGNALPLVTSDGISIVLLGTSAGIFLYDTDTPTTKPIKINKTVATGLAYDGEQGVFMVLTGDGTFSNISLDGTMTELAPGYSKLYDTVDGYFVSVGGVTSVTGSSKSTVPTGGNYGAIQLIIT